MKDKMLVDKLKEPQINHSQNIIKLVSVQCFSFEG